MLGSVHDSPYLWFLVLVVSYTGGGFVPYTRSCIGPRYSFHVFAHNIHFSCLLPAIRTSSSLLTIRFLPFTPYHFASQHFVLYHIVS